MRKNKNSSVARNHKNRNNDLQNPSNKTLNLNLQNNFNHQLLPPAEELEKYKELGILDRIVTLTEEGTRAQINALDEIAAIDEMDVVLGHESIKRSQYISILLYILSLGAGLGVFFGSIYLGVFEIAPVTITAFSTAVCASKFTVDIVLGRNAQKSNSK